MVMMGEPRHPGLCLCKRNVRVCESQSSETNSDQSTWIVTKSNNALIVLLLYDVTQNICRQNLLVSKCTPLSLGVFQSARVPDSADCSHHDSQAAGTELSPLVTLPL